MAIEIKREKKKREHKERAGLNISITGNRISGKDRMFFTERLSLLLETGGVLHLSLLELKRQTEKPALASIIGDLAEDVQVGKQLSQSMKRHPEMFSTTCVNLVAASEQGGFLHVVLKRLTDMEENRERLKSTLVSAFSYPLFLTLFSFGVTIFILVFVFPKFDTLFSSIRDELPFTTVVLMGTSHFLKQYWYIVISLSALFTFIFFKWVISTSGRKSISALKLKLPIIKNIFIRLYLINLLRTLGFSLENGVVILDALKSSREISDNSLFREFVVKLETDVQEGRGVASGFEESKLIPSMVKQMIRTGEESGNLHLVMNRVSDFYEGELEKKLQFLSKIAEPFMLLFMGLVVGVIVASLILPIFKISRAVH